LTLNDDLRLAIVYFAFAVFIILVPIISWIARKYVRHIFGRASRNAMLVLKSVR